MGTAEYVSPELLTDKSVTTSSDWWAFGCVLFQMLAGRPPFKGVSEYQTFQKILKRDFTFPDGLDEPAQALIDKLLVLDPEERWGASSDDVKRMRACQFFAEEDFATLWERPAPELKVGIYKRPAAPPTPPSNFFDDDDGLSFTSEAADALSPPTRSLHGTSEDADASDGSDSSGEGDSRAEGKAPAQIRRLPHKQSELSIRSSASSADDARNGFKLQRRHSQGVPGPARTVSNWGALLLPRESLLLSAPIIQKKTGTMFNKKRQLVLTSFPRLLCVKEGPATLKVKSEILLQTEPVEASAESTTAQKEQASQLTATSIEAKNAKTFAVHTVSAVFIPGLLEQTLTNHPPLQPSRTFVYEDPSGDNSHWVRSIRQVMDK